MTLTNIRLFIEAARLENFTKAASNQFVSQPALSKHIAQIEQELGVTLFERAGRTVKLTPAGKYLYEQLSEVMQLADHAFGHAKALARGAAESLSIGILQGQDISGRLLNALNTLPQRYPRLDVRFERNSFSNLRSGLESGHYDMILTLMFELDSLPPVKYERLLQQHGAIAISRANPLASKPDLCLADLKDEDFITISAEESPNGYELLCRDCERSGFTPRIVRYLTSLESLLLGIEVGIGVAILDRNTRLENHPGVRIQPIESNYDTSLIAAYLSQNPKCATAQIARELRPDAADTAVETAAPAAVI